MTGSGVGGVGGGEEPSDDAAVRAAQL